MIDEKFYNLVEEIVKDFGSRIYHIAKQGNKLLVFIEGDAPITVGLCEKISRDISFKINMYFPQYKSFTLEVSSPGIERHLYNVEHYKDAIGEIVSIKTKDRRLKGELKDVFDNSILLKEGNSDIEIYFEDIITAKIIVSTEELFRRVKHG